MNQFGQGNTNDLQKAIDEITGGSASAGVASDAPAASDATAELEDQIKGQMGVPPTPPTSGEGVPEMAIPGAQAPAEGAPAGITPMGAAATEVSQAEVSPVNPNGDVAAAPEMMAEGQNTVAASASPEMGGDLAKVRESALQELVPLMDKVEIPADEKFNIYTEVIETTRDKSIVEKAFEAARNIADEKQKAESLLKLVKMIDTL